MADFDLNEVFKEIKATKTQKDPRESNIKDMIAEAEQAEAILEIYNRTGIASAEITATLEKHAALYGNIASLGSNVLTVNTAIGTAAKLNNTTYEQEYAALQKSLAITTDMNKEQKEKVLLLKATLPVLDKMNKEMIRINTEAGRFSNQLKEVMKFKKFGDISSMKPGFTKGALTGESQGGAGGFGGIAGKAVSGIPGISSILVAAKVTGALISSSVDLVDKGVKSFNQVMTGLDGAFTAGANLLEGTVSKLNSTLGSIVGGMANAFATAIKFTFEDTLAQNKMRMANLAQTGSSSRSIAGREAWEEKKYLGREGAIEYGQGITRMGGGDASGVVGKAARYSAMTGVGASGTLKELEQAKILTGTVVEGMNMLNTTWDVARGLAKNTNLSTAGVAKGIMEAAAASRFMNVDLKVVSSTMGMLVSQREKLIKGGITEGDFGGITKQLTGAGAAGKTGLMAYLGMQAGETDAMKGWTRMRFGAESAKNIKQVGGGFEGVTNTGGAPTMDFAKGLKGMMVTAAAGKSGDEALLAQKKVAMEVGGLDEQGSTALALIQTKDISDKTLQEMKKSGETSKQKLDNLYGLLVTWQTKSETIQRAMSNLTLQIFRYLLVVPKDISLSIKSWFPSYFGGGLLDSEKDQQRLIGTEKKLAVAQSVESMKVVMGTVASVVPALGNVSKLTQTGMSAADISAVNVSQGNEATKLRSRELTGDSRYKGEAPAGSDLPKGLKPGDSRIVLRDPSKDGYIGSEPIKYRAHGGSAIAPYVAGEHGPELILPGFQHGSGDTVIPNGSTNSFFKGGGSLGGGGSTLTINIDGITKDQVLNEVMAQLRQLL